MLLPHLQILTAGALVFAPVSPSCLNSGVSKQHGVLFPQLYGFMKVSTPPLLLRNAIHAMHMQCKFMFVAAARSLVLALASKLRGFLGCKVSLIVLLTCIPLDFV